LDDWWKLEHSSEPPRVGRPALLTDPEVIVLSILAQWPRLRSERDFWRFAPDGVICAFGLAEASSDERPIGEALVASDRHGAYLADKGFTGVEWERRWLQEYGALVAATP
jgi:hypothetical protein